MNEIHIWDSNIDKFKKYCEREKIHIFQGEDFIKELNRFIELNLELLE